MQATPFLVGKDIYFRELRESDLPDWYVWFNDAQTTRFQNKHIFPNSIEKQKAYYNFISQSSTDVVFAIIDSQTHKHIGNVGLHHLDWVHRSAELGIVLGNKDFWGKGLGKQAWYLITHYGFDTLNLHRIYAQVLTENLPSAKCAEGVGFRKEGHIRNMFYKNGKYCDVFYYNLLKEDFKPQQP